MKLNQRSPIFQEVLCYSAIRQQWLVAFNSNGTVEGLIPRQWFNTKAEALEDLINALKFREGLVANCEPICHRIYELTQELKTLKQA